MVSVYVHFLWLLCLVFVPIYGHIQLPKNEDNNELSLAATAAHLARKYFCKDSTTVVLIERSTLLDTRDSHRLIYEYILQNLNESIAVQLFSGNTDSQPWEYHILIVDSEEAFFNIAASFPENSFDGEFRFLVILTIYLPTDFLRTIEAIFELCKDNNVINVNVLLNHEIMGVCMYSYKIFSDTKCRVVQPFLHFRLIDGFDNLEEVFPKKLLNFHKCPLRICGQLNHPMLTFAGNQTDPHTNDGKWKNLNGIDGQLIRIIAKSLNFTIDMLPFSQERTYLENYTGFGCYAELLSGNADIAIGGFSGSDPTRTSLTPSVLYHHSPMVFIVRGRRELDCANRLGRPFSFGVWLCIILLLLSGTFLIQSLRMLKKPHRLRIVGEDNDGPLLNFLSAFLGYPVTAAPAGYLARYLLILWLVMTLVIRSAYQGSLYDSIRIDRYDKIPHKYEDLFRQKYKFIITRAYLGLGIFSRNETIIVDQPHSERLKLLAQLDGKYATVALQDHVISYLESNFRKGSDLRIINEQIYQFQTAMFFQKHSIYATPINANLNHYNFAGIMRHIVRNNVKDWKIFRDSMKGGPLRALNNDRIWSLYKIFVRLMIFTMGVFLLEMVSVYSEKVRKALNWLH
ncbi:uncharacterized protein LOC129944780 [Eupeodes corollae]|uniref:uncharacterized protein LOC129944780 n=1 Tax=Eupeodes corollae TaxID=290404 RepID=UPI00248F813B|nr:uncharacterized protein LOC129944780 [Eupeodes corollae]